MDKIDLSAVDICRIIKQCAGANVAELRFHGLHLTFHSHRNESVATPRQGASASVVPTDEAQAQPELNLMDEESLIQAEEAQLLIDNPLGYERYQIAQEMERMRTQ